MDKDPRHPTHDDLTVALGEITTRQIESVPADASLSVISRLNTKWVVLTGNDGEIVGVINRDVAVEAANAQSIAYLARRKHFEVLPADLQLGSPRLPIVPRSLVVTGLVVALSRWLKSGAAQLGLEPPL